MKKVIFFLLISIVLFNGNLFSQRDIIPTIGKYSYHFGLGFSSMFNEKLSLYTLTFQPSFKFGYNINNHFMPFVGIDYANKINNVNEYNYKIFGSSIGFRYYFFKNNILFIESSLQGGNYRNKDSSDNFFFIQPGVGLGVNFNLVDKFNSSKLSFDIMFRYNFVNQNLKKYQKENLSTFGPATIGFRMTFPYSPNELKNNFPLDTNNKHNKLLNLWSIGLNPFNLKLSYERVYSPSMTTVYELQNRNYLSLFTKNVGYIPTISIEPRYYYSFHKRKLNGQSTRNNSANFLSLIAKFEVGIQNEINGIPWQASLGSCWGIKRSVGKHLSFEYKLGLEVYYTWYDISGIGPSSMLGLSYVF